MNDRSAVTTFLFSDIEGSTRLWERAPDRMRTAMARHDALARAAVARNHGTIVKMTGDGMHAAFTDPLAALRTALEYQQGLAEVAATHDIAVAARCGVHVGTVEHRDGDYFGSAVNRAARIMRAAHGGQVLLSQAAVEFVRDRLPAGVTLRHLGSIRLRDMESPEHVHQLVQAGLRQAFPALGSHESTPNNLPVQLTSFVGRERELREAAQALEGTRLLTLHGPGGIGKTRLSLQLATLALEAYHDGVWFVELAGLADPRLVPQAVATALGTKEDGRPILDALLAHTGERTLLVVLDNCEHLLQACAELATRLLRSGPGVKVLTSSRERLNVAGEVIYEVPALAVPVDDRALAAADVARYEAVRLFSERATAARPRFAITDDNATAVAAICRRLDGIPLALELAAARVRALSVDEIAGRLDDRFRVLTGGDRTALPRQQTLRALIDWSYELLAPHERTLLARLAVFSGGFTLSAAEDVAAGEPIDGADVLDLVGNLVEKSLVAVEAEGTRYHLLDTVKHYATERLETSGEAPDCRARHLDCYLALAEAARPELVGAAQAEWLARLDLERENLLSAHAWAGQARDGDERGLRLVSALRRYWMIRGLPELGLRVTREALAREGAQRRTYARCQGCFDAGQLCSFMGRYGEAQVHLEECLAIARERDDRRSIALVLQPLGIAYHGQGDLATARGHFEAALAMAREIGNPREIAAALIALAQLHRVEGRLETAEPLYEQALALARELGDREIVGIGLLNLAMVAIGRGSHAGVRGMLREALAIAKETGSQPAGLSVLEVCAGLDALRGAWEHAARIYGAAEAQMARTGLKRDRTDEAFLAPLIATAREALGHEAYAAVEASGRSLAFDDAIADVHAWLARDG